MSDIFAHLPLHRCAIRDGFANQINHPQRFTSDMPDLKMRHSICVIRFPRSRCRPFEPLLSFTSMNSTPPNPLATWIVIADNQLSTILCATTDDFSDIQPVLEIPFPGHPEHPDCKLTHVADSHLTEEGDFSLESLTNQFARLIADELEQGLLDQEFQRVILIATTQLLELMHTRMSSELSKLVDQRLDLEMMKEPLHVIAARLQTGIYRKQSLEN